MTRNTPFDGASGSRFGQRIRRRYAAQLALLPAGVPSRDTLYHVFNVLLSQGADTATALRTLRQLVLERLVELDCNQDASLSSVTTVMTELA
jgi:glutamate-ammonia-ligase adenylyltransferase